MRNGVLVLLTAFILALPASSAEPAATPLGTAAQVTILTLHPAESRKFFQELGFRPVGLDAGPHAPWQQLSDGVLTISLEEGRDGGGGKNRTPVLTYSAPDMERRVRNLSDTIRTLKVRRNKVGAFVSATFTDPNGQPVVLLNRPLESSSASGHSFARCGTFGELSIHAGNLETSIEFWQQFGFRVTTRETRPYPWATLTDGMLTIGLHQSKTVRHSTLTYFAPDMLRRIEQLKLDGLPHLKDWRDPKGRVDGATMKAPDGQEFFLFGP